MIRMATDVAANGSSAVVTVPTITRRSNPQRVVQVDLSGTITVAIEGRLDAAASWYVILSTSTDTSQLIALMPEMRVTASGVSGGVANVWLDAEQV